MTLPTDRCEHFDAIRKVDALTRGCAECTALGVPWMSLRACMTCGHVGCCEDSKYAHALAHFNETGHPMISSLEGRDTWAWCYVHARYFDRMPGPLPRKYSAIRSLLSRLAGR